MVARDSAQGFEHHPAATRQQAAKSRCPSSEEEGFNRLLQDRKDSRWGALRQAQGYGSIHPLCRNENRSR